MNAHPERKIQAKVINWCREQGLKVYATANGQFLNTWSAINERSTMGKGLSDLVIIVPAKRSVTDSTMILFAEVKSDKGRPSKEQLEFIDLVNSVEGDIEGKIVKGYDEAIQFLSLFVKDKPDLTDEQVLDIINNL
jgi:hypothetical protein